MFIPKINRLYLYVAAYAVVMAFLACVGYVELKEMRAEEAEKARSSIHNAALSRAENKAIYEMPSMDLSLPSYGGTLHRAEIGINLEIDKENLVRFEGFQPRVEDRVIGFLYRQNVDEIRKPTALPDLRRRLLEEVNKASTPIPVSDVIFREFMVN